MFCTITVGLAVDVATRIFCEDAALDVGRPAGREVISTVSRLPL